MTSGEQRLTGPAVGLVAWWDERPRVWGGIYIVFGCASVGWNCAFAILATRPCAGRSATAICGWSLSKTAAVVVGSELVMLAILLLVLGVLAVRQLGWLPEGLALRTRLATFLVPWSRIDVRPMPGHDGAARLRILPQRPAPGAMARSIRISPDLAQAVGVQRNRLQGAPSGLSSPR